MVKSSIRRALAAAGSGTATLDHYAMIFEESIEAERLRLLGSVPALVAREDAGGQVTAQSALAYWPGVPLPAVITAAINEKVAFATRRPGGPTAEGPAGAFAWWRAATAFAVLALGESGLPVRERAWQASPDGPAPSEEVSRLSRVNSLTVAEADAFLGLGRHVADAVARGLVQPTGDARDLRFGRARVTYAQIAEVVTAAQARGELPRGVRGPGLA